MISLGTLSWFVSATLAAVPCTEALPVGPGGEFDAADCPQVYQIHGSAEPSTAWNLVLLPEGFAEDDLEAFRCAASHLVQELLQSEPFRSYACRINVYRMDFSVDSPGGIEVNPACAGCSSSRVAWPWTEPVPDCAKVRSRSPGGGPLYGQAVPMTGSASPPECYRWSFGIKHCSDGTNCRLLWPPEDQQVLLQTLAAACAPEASVVLVIVNSTTRGGVGQIGNAEGSFVFGVVSAFDLHKSNGWVHFAHELGHTWGLIDEYPNANPLQYEAGRNIAAKADLASGGTLSLPPWNDLCNPKPATPYGQPLDPSLECRIHCATINGCTCWDNTNHLIPPNSQNHVVLNQSGLLGSSCDYFRSQKSCRMDTDSPPFCAACVLWLHTWAGGFPLSTCSTSGGPARREGRWLEIRPLVPGATDRGAESGWTLDGRPISSEHILRGEIPEALVGSVSKMIAQVRVDGLRGEIPISEFTLLMVLRDRVGREHELRVRWTSPSPPRQLEWTLDGRPLQPVAFPLGAVAGTLVLEGPVKGAIRVTVAGTEEQLDAGRVLIRLQDPPGS